MNPRLGHLQLTEEDLHLWGSVLERFRPKSACYWYEKTLQADRWDADLMFSAQRYRSYTFPVELPPVKVLSHNGWSWIVCGGALEHWKTLNLGYFA
jgi:hypothetical protein